MLITKGIADIIHTALVAWSLLYRVHIIQSKVKATLLDSLFYPLKIRSMKSQAGHTASTGINEWRRGDSDNLGFLQALGACLLYA